MFTLTPKQLYHSCRGSYSRGTYGVAISLLLPSSEVSSAKQDLFVAKGSKILWVRRRGRNLTSWVTVYLSIFTKFPYVLRHFECSVSIHVRPKSHTMLPISTLMEYCRVFIFASTRRFFSSDLFS